MYPPVIQYEEQRRAVEEEIARRIARRQRRPEAPRCVASTRGPARPLSFQPRPWAICAASGERRRRIIAATPRIGPGARNANA